MDKTTTVLQASPKEQIGAICAVDHAGGKGGATSAADQAGGKDGRANRPEAR
jgi:hypothetical protein